MQNREPITAGVQYQFSFMAPDRTCFSKLLEVSFVENLVQRVSLPCAGLNAKSIAVELSGLHVIVTRNSLVCKNSEGP